MGLLGGSYEKLFIYFSMGSHLLSFDHTAKQDGFGISIGTHLSIL